MGDGSFWDVEIIDVMSRSVAQRTGLRPFPNPWILSAETDLMVPLEADPSERVRVDFISHDFDEALYVSDEVVMLSKSPAKVLKRFVVPFERPRRHDLLMSIEFSNLRREALATFIQEVAR